MGININGVEWSIVFTSDSENLKRPDGSITLGVTDINCKTIFIWVGLKDSLLKKVIIHELCHAFVFSHNHVLPLDEEEFLCSFVDTYAIDVLSITNEILLGKNKKLS